MVWKQLFFFFHSQLLQGTNVVIIDITCGVPQGSILGLLLFSVYKSLGQTLNTTSHFTATPMFTITVSSLTDCSPSEHKQKKREREARSINYLFLIPFYAHGQLIAKGLSVSGLSWVWNLFKQLKCGHYGSSVICFWAGPQ